MVSSPKLLISLLYGWPWLYENFFVCVCAEPESAPLPLSVSFIFHLCFQFYAGSGEYQVIFLSQPTT